jgi:hypothetical protein
MSFEVRRYDDQGWFIESSPEKFATAGEAMDYCLKDEWKFTAIIRDSSSPVQEHLSRLDIVV